MKKVFIAAMAAAALMLQACGNSANGGQQNDSTAVEVPTVEEPIVAEAQEVVNALSAAVESSDAETLKSQVEKSVAYVQQLVNEGKSEEAARYMEQIKQFVSDNKAKIDNIASGNETINGLISTITSTPQTVSEAAKAVSESAETAVEDIKENVKQKADEEAKKATDAVKEQAGKAVDDAANAIKGKLGI